ncbi:helix-turn-helix domain-containing protein [Rhodobacter sp. KR11]|uniref:helix-turn-helix domain-containing protein n=1 Tax=Rhodobacter sp. KR11 TaxID=2974588 RepID=UPI0022236FA9|nr:helix-turn-helix domain-containing protein [Rhodobacter sp. KR11]MCW1917811.1 helix-turn-helix domain-containing protein [Rhodobacter sp. KR11]
MQNPSLRSDLPAWVPGAVRLYLDHTEQGLSLRAIARRDGCHASTVLRQVRRYEGRRDDPLLDEALSSLVCRDGESPHSSTKEDPMSAPIRHQILDDKQIAREGLRVLRRLAEPGAVLAVAPDMEKAVVMREFPDGRSARTGVVDRAFAQAFALKDWISIRKAGRVTSYELSTVGRMALKRMLETEEGHKQGLAQGMAEAPMVFGHQHREWATREIATEEGPRRMRYNLAESPVAVLGRRRDKDGKVFLPPELVDAAERLREDYELAQMGPRVAQNWERFLTGSDRGGFRSDGLAEGPRAARDRVAAALRDLGPGLGDVALRVCCFLEGIEAAERRMGWAARSGKIVLRIALQRLRRHYDETYGRSGPLIG